MTAIMSTVGIDCETVPFSGGEVTIHDFGGQLEYSTTHHLFLSTEVIIQHSHSLRNIYIAYLLISLFLKDGGLPCLL